MNVRLDQYLLDQELVETRSKARGLIIDKKVIVNNEKITKPGTMVNPEKIVVKIINDDKEFVSRAGKKLLKALKDWNISLNGLVCLDIGSSTGGFTQCCLEYDAEKVYALDVGTNQLDYNLRINPKVISMEKTNFRYVEKDMFDSNINFFCCDVSFISLEKILPTLDKITDLHAFGVMLIKPQFESNREDIIKGKASDIDKHVDVIQNVFDFTISNNFSVLNLSFSPILGNKKKNIEYIMLIKKEEKNRNEFSHQQIKNVIDEAKLFFNGVHNE